MERLDERITLSIFLAYLLPSVCLRNGQSDAISAVNMMKMVELVVRVGILILLAYTLPSVRLRNGQSDAISALKYNEDGRIRCEDKCTRRTC